MSHNVLIEIVSDVVCPWCYIGKRRMEKALTMLQRSDIELQWRAFDLNAGTPKGGVPWRAHMIRKFGSLAYARRLEAHVAAAATEDGITLRFDRIERLPKTLDAHRLIWLAGREGMQPDLAERLYHAYFVNGEDIGTHETLTKIASAAGLNLSRIADFLDSESGVSEIVAEQNATRSLGGVPAFFMNGMQIASGAQSHAVLASAIQAALPRLEGGAGTTGRVLPPN